ISDAVETSLTLNGRNVTVHSTLEHETRAIALLGGYAFDLSDRVTVHALGGITSTHVIRTFTSDAGSLVLSRPSTLPPLATETRDSFSSWSLGADLFVRQSRRLHLTAGVRAEPLNLPVDIT